MSSRKRVASSGAERAEFEHVFGALETDPQDPRFVLVDEETEKKLREFPPGVPPVVEQSHDSKVKIREAQLDAAGKDAADEDVKSPSTPGASKVKKGDVIAQGVKPKKDETP